MELMSMDLLDPRVDFVFKRIFGSENNKDVLLAFLNRIFTEAGEPPLTEIILMNPYTNKEDPLDKQSIFDVYAKTSEGKLIDIEMQLFNKYDIEKRTLFYWSKRYASQLSEGDKYPELKKCVTINILNYSFLKNNQYHNVFHLREDRTGLPLIDDIEVHFLELPKLDERSVPTEGGLINWLLFLKGTDTSYWEVLKMNEPGLEKAMDTLQYLSQDSDARRLYEARQKYLHDEASMIEGAKCAGIIEGKLQVARNLLAMGMDYAAVAKATGLSEDEIRSIKF
ncbi:Rpn family recombination-promoting nuclease/putative transposase [Paenibacillus sonchi]|uniref:Rpn family recombination-promoting nuclease/putative transposase n=1 Tax=Paenibacillus sonchi TaxID=373687 RepID=UPI001E45FA3B|nr:Rpn family recombination-promoting nuclease/putative transposase [Paenibacillus sonchi]MCE3198201.1 Rpn family recombination-promoting nuclease/putative transposase [Paenibacillus sonchi]